MNSHCASFWVQHIGLHLQWLSVIESSFPLLHLIFYHPLCHIFFSLRIIFIIMSACQSFLMELFNFLYLFDVSHDLLFCLWHLTTIVVVVVVVIEKHSNWRFLSSNCTVLHRTNDWFFLLFFWAGADEILLGIWFWKCIQFFSFTLTFSGFKCDRAIWRNFNFLHNYKNKI